MQVLEVWKGRRLPAEVVVNGGPEDTTQQTAVDRRFLLGQVYLVLPANSRPPFRDSLCTGTQLWATPTGQIPEHLQAAVGGATPIQTFGPGGGQTPGPSALGGADEGIDPLIIAMAAVLAIYLVVYIVRRVGPLANRRKEREAAVAGNGGLDAASLRPKRKKRLGRRFTMPRFIESRRGTRIEQVRRSRARFGKGPGEHERRQLERAVKLTATHPPKRKNHYTSGRRAAP